MNFLAQMQQAQSSFRQQQPKPKPQPKAAAMVSNIGDRPGISITALQSSNPRKSFNAPSRNQLVVEPVRSQGPSSALQPPWPTPPRGRPPLHPRSAISVLPASRLMKPSPSDASLAALSRLQGANQLQVTPRPRGRPMNPLNAARSRPRLNSPNQWPGMPPPVGALAPGAANAPRPGRAAGPRAGHAQALAKARAQAYHEMEQVRAKALYQLQQSQRLQSQQMTRPAAAKVSAPAATQLATAAAAGVVSAAGAAGAPLDPEIITLE